MAKRDKEEPSGKDEDYVFEMPDFDEDAFIHKELVSFKTTGVLFVWGIVAALVSWGIFEVLGGAQTGWYLGLGVVVVFGYLLRFLYPRLGLDIKHFGRREWLGTGFLLFFTWLAFFLLFVNPPVTDHAPPLIEVVASPPIQQVGGDVVFDLFFEDNHRIAAMTFALTSGSGATVATLDDAAEIGRGHYRYVLSNATGTTYSYTATATDAKGNEAETAGDVQASANALRVQLPRENAILQTPDTVFVTIVGSFPQCDENIGRRITPCHLNVFLEFEGRDDIRMTYDAELDGWKATGNTKGWQPGENTFGVVSEMQALAFGPNVLEPARIVRAGPFTVDVAPEISGDAESAWLVQDLTSHNAKRTPGPGVVAIGLLLAGIVAVARRDRTR